MRMSSQLASPCPLGQFSVKKAVQDTLPYARPLTQRHSHLSEVSPGVILVDLHYYAAKWLGTSWLDVRDAGHADG